MEETTPNTAALSGLSLSAIPADATDCGDGFYIEQSTEPCGEPRYRSCSPGGAIGRYSNDLWQAQIYIEHLKGNLPGGSSNTPA
mgnify:CR=1 FL=1